MYLRKNKVSKDGELYFACLNVSFPIYYIHDNRRNWKKVKV